ncbi:hypothetical protein M426DRAFT_14057 [Hypoxylon sp. CI-4A]|nr:hypothetical protein M426DRAFT_14057 [Hypoxylon sp. CI-4A]
MDPLSIVGSVASIAQVAAYAGGLAKGLGRFVEKNKHIHETIQGVHTEISELQNALTELQKTLGKRRRQHEFERGHHTNIERIVQSCYTTLETLERELPQLKDKAGPIERLCRSLEHVLKEERIQELIQRISYYKGVLQLSLSTLSLGALLETQSSQRKIQAEIRKLTDAIRASPYLSPSRARNEIPPIRIHGPGSKPREDDNQESILEKEIREWRETADDVAEAVSLQDPDEISIHSRNPPNSFISVDTLPQYEEDTYDPEPGSKDVYDVEIVKCMLDANRNFAKGLTENGLFGKAAAYQRKGIDLIKDFLGAEPRTQSDDVSPEKLTEMREELADILIRCESNESYLEAKTMLQQLLEDEVHTEKDQIDSHRRARLYHKLGHVYFKQNNIGQARKFAMRALEGRKQIQPMPRELVAKTAELLVQILQHDQAFGEVRGLREWVRKELHLDAHLPSLSMSQETIDSTGESVSASLTGAYQWCKEQGFNVDSETFSFDSCDPEKGVTPMHWAIQAENIEVLRHMVGNVTHLEQRDSSGSTLLHSAAATRNRYLCELLLKDQKANPDVVDCNDSTPLHKCQSNARGIGVAEMLLERCPDLVDRRDAFGKTALFIACEKGNQKMVQFLLAEGKANPNIPGPGKRTPLIVAIELAAQSARKIPNVQLLLQHGADQDIPDAEGRTASVAAKNAGLAGSEIKQMLKRFPSRRPSTATTSTTRSSNTRRESSNTSIVHTLAK